MFILNATSSVIGGSQFDSLSYTKPYVETASTDKSNTGTLGMPSRPGVAETTKLSTLPTGKGNTKPDASSTGTGNKLKEALTKLQEVIENILERIAGNKKSEAPTIAKSSNDKPGLTTKTDQNQSGEKDKFFAAILTFLTAMLEAATQEESTTTLAASKGSSTSPTGDVSTMQTTSPLDTGDAQTSLANEGFTKESKV